jgi:outer membrane protein TolC
VGDVTYASPNQRYFPPQQEWNATWAVGLVASWTVGDAFLNGAVGAELDANARGMEAQRRGVMAAITNEVVAAHLDVSNALAALNTSDTALRAAGEAYRVTTDLFRAGRATTTDLIEAESELLAARLTATDARIDLNIAMLRLHHASGADVTSVPPSASASAR